MGLDIYIQPNSNNIESNHGLSREFCYQITLLDENQQDSIHPPVLRQVYALYELDCTILCNMNVWKMEAAIRYEPSSVIKEDVAKYYENAFQPVHLVLENLETLYAKISLQPKLLNEVKWQQAWKKKYFEHFHENIGEYAVDRNFGWDLRTMLEYLRSLPKHSSVRFGYV